MQMKKAIWCATGLVLGLFLVYLIYPVLALDGLGGLLAPLIVGNDTEYAPEYSHRSFMKISPGMNGTQVEEIIGPPLDKYVVQETGETGWLYSRTPSDSSYRERAILFRDGKVVERLSGFYVD